MHPNVIYLDNNATTRVDPRVLDAMAPFFTERYGNASSTHRFGADNAAAVESAREAVAAAIGARESEIVFTSGGTEADNTALRGVLAADPRRRRLVISTVEHHAVLECAEALEAAGVDVTRIAVDRDGRLDLDALAAAVGPDTALVSIMLANNETGVLSPLRDVCEIAARQRVPVHTDAVNALGKTPINVESLGVSLLSLSAHKCYGPKGVGALYIRRTAPFRAVQIGGGQERRRRGGTLNVPGIVGLGRACELIVSEPPGETERIRRLRDRLEAGVLAMDADAHVIARAPERLPNTSCVCFAGLPSEPIIVGLSEAGVCVSAGAACSSGSLEVSHVLRAMGVEPHVGHGQVRFSLGRFNSEADVDGALESLRALLSRVRAAYARK